MVYIQYSMYDYCSTVLYDVYTVYWSTRPCAVSVEERSVGRRTGNAGLEMKNI
jgi:hypothetical protein